MKALKWETPKRWAITLTLLIVIAAIAALFIISNEGIGVSPVEKITMGVVKIEASSLVYIADSKGMFRKHGLDVILREYPAGGIAAGDLLENKVDLITATEFVVVTRSFSRSDVRVLASIVRGDTHEVVARKDRGIAEPSDLKGKRIALTRNTIADFYMSTFLSMNGIPAGSVRLVDLKPSEIVDAVASGAVDATLIWEPLVWQIKEHLGSNAIKWPAQSGYGYYFTLMTTEAFVRGRPVAADRLIKALLEAETYSSQNRAETQKLMAQRLEYDPALIQSIWQRCDFRVRLDQELLILMEDEAKWARDHGMTEQVPNYFTIVHLGSLEKVRPYAVTVIH